MNFELTHGERPTNVPQSLGRLRVVLEDAYVRGSRQLGLTAQQAELLCAALTPTAVGDLADVMRCDRSNVSRLVDRASARGWLRRRGGEDDARVTMVELTPEGRRLAERFIEYLVAGTRDLLDAWSPERRDTATAILNEIADALDERRQPDARARRRRQAAAPHAGRGAPS
jgi:DNA-binding MarR family transcriptional regulator